MDRIFFAIPCPSSPHTLIIEKMHCAMRGFVGVGVCVFSLLRSNYKQSWS